MKHGTLVAACVACVVILTGCSFDGHLAGMEDIGDLAAELRADIDDIRATAPNDPETLAALDAMTAKYDELMATVAPIIADARDGDGLAAGAKTGGLIGSMLGPQGAALGTLLGGLVGGAWQRRRGNAIVSNLATTLDSARRKTPELDAGFKAADASINARLSSETRKAVARARANG